MDNFNNVQAQPFFNTINLNEIEWATENDKAIALQKTIRKIYEANPGIEITGWQMKRYLDEKLNKKHNILSVRRSISNLKKELVIDKTVNMRIGEENQPEHFYVLRGSGKVVEKAMSGVSTGEFAKNILSHQTLTQPDLFGNNKKESGKVDN